MGRLTWILAVLVAAAGCQADDEVPHARDTALAQAGAAARGLGFAALTRDQLMDPKTCAGCHPIHYREWEQSMHAYAANDPVFLAMNQRGQRETQGALGDFCVKCHAPMAVREGLTTDGLNLDRVPQKLKGVTCYFCHNAVDVGPDHFNNPIVLANDTTMRGSIRDPVSPGVHGVAYDALFDNASARSSYMCGACHDIVNAKGTHIERTLAEYEASIFDLAKRSLAQGGESCQGCHMRGKISDYVTVIPDAQLPKRELHEHSWPGVDVALTDWPGDAAFRKRTACELRSGANIFEVSSDGRGLFTVKVETQAGHAQPSGSAQDRRLWLEFVAYDAQGRVMLKSGVIGDGEVEDKKPGAPGYDRNLFIMRDYFYGDDGEEVHMFWEAARVDPRLIPAPTVPGVEHVRMNAFQIPTRQQPARVELRLLMRPIGIDVLQDLVASGDLDPSVIARMPTFELPQTKLVWTPAKGLIWRPRPPPLPDDCFNDDPSLNPAQP